jgi:hypothetical protein
MAFTRTPRGANSWARVHISVVVPPFEAAQLT